MKSKKVSIQGSHGAALSAMLNTPNEGEPRACALMAHCFTCNKDYKALRYISHELTSRGYSTLRFDFTGLGESEGEFSATGFSSNVEDLIAAAAWLREHHQAPTLLIGHSMGGAASVHAAPKIPESKAVALLAAPAVPGHLSNLLADQLDGLEREGRAKVNIGGNTYTLTQEFFDELNRLDHRSALESLDRALLILHSPLDRTVDIENAAKSFQWARHPKSFVSLDQADHLLSKAEDARYAGAVIAAWAERYI
ncbi:MAG: alpha/beta fold hydrolase [bacterium]|nr:alpha/beta fold hydrolase [bacterium]